MLFSGVQVPHFSYVGDSILGFKAHLGAGVILSNAKSMKGNVMVKYGNDIDTGLRKFGAIIGDGCDIGCNCVLNPGSIIGRNTVLYPNILWRGVCPPTASSSYGSSLRPSCDGNEPCVGDVADRRIDYRRTDKLSFAIALASPPKDGGCRHFSVLCAEAHVVYLDLREEENLVLVKISRGIGPNGLYFRVAAGSS